MSEMISLHPNEPQVAADVLAECVDECFDCAEECNICADACLAEESVAELRRCIRLNLDCADICIATGKTISRMVSPSWNHLAKQLEACQAACRACADECERHASSMEHCRVCAESCRECDQACQEMLAALPS